MLWVPMRKILGHRDADSGNVLRAILTRAFIILLGLAGVAWGAANLPAFWRQTGIEQIASEILDHQMFKPKALDPIHLDPRRNRTIAHYCQPKLLRSAAIIRLRLAEEAIASAERDVIDERLMLSKTAFVMRWL